MLNVLKRVVGVVAVLLMGGAALAQAPADIAALRVQADAGDAAAQFNLGFAYSFGEGVPQDDVQAVSWFRQAAEQGHAIAQYNLGVMYASCFYRVPQVVPTPLRMPCDTR